VKIKLPCPLGGIFYDTGPDGLSRELQLRGLRFSDPETGRPALLTALAFPLPDEAVTLVCREDERGTDIVIPDDVIRSSGAQGVRFHAEGGFARIVPDGPSAQAGRITPELLACLAPVLPEARAPFVSERSGRAVYTIVDDGRKSCLYSRYGANQYLAFCAVRDAELLVPTLNYEPENIADVLETLVYNQFDLQYERSPEKEEPLFLRIPAERARELAEEFGESPLLQMHVVLDFDRDEVRFRHNPAAYNGAPPPDFTIGISEGILCLDDLVDEAACEGERPADAIRDRMPGKLAQAVQRGMQETGPWSQAMQL